MKSGKLNRVIAFAMSFLMGVSSFAPNAAMTVQAKGVQADEAEATLTEAPAAVKGLSYNGLSQKLVTAGKSVSDDGVTPLKVVYAISEDRAVSEDYSEEIPTGIDAGTYTVWYKVSENAADSTAVSINVTIDTTAISSNMLTGVKDTFEYDGKEKEVEFSLKIGEYELEEGKDFEVVAGSAVKATEVGTYTVSLNGINNCTGKVEIEWSIAEKAAPGPGAQPEVETAPVAKSLSYNGAAQELVTAGKAKNGVMNYAVSNNDVAPAEGWSAEIPAATDAGEYVVWYKAVSGNAATEAVSVNAAIAKAKIELDAPADGAKLKVVFNGKEQALLPEIKVPAGAEILYTVNGVSVNAPVGTERADYKVTFEVKGGKNYLDVAKRTVTVTIDIGELDKALTLEGLGKDGAAIEVVLTAPAESVSYNGKKHVSDTTVLSAKKQKSMANDLKLSIIGLEDYAELYKVSYTYKNNTNASTAAKAAQYNIQIKLNKKAAAYTALDKKAKKALTKAVKAANKKLKKDGVVKFQIGAANIGTFAFDAAASSDKAAVFTDAAKNTITVNLKSTKKGAKIKSIKVVFGGNKKLTASKKQIAREISGQISDYTLKLTGNGNYTGEISFKK